MKQLKLACCSLLFLSCYGQSFAQDELPDIVKGFISHKVDLYIEEGGPQKLCDKKLERIPSTLCSEALACAAQSISGKGCDESTLKQTARQELKKPEFLNSALSNWMGQKTPFGFEFKTLDSEESGASVLGLTYDIDRAFFKGSEVKNTAKYIVEREGSFNASGTITNDSDKNPRNFLETKLTASQSYTTRIPVQSREFADQLTELVRAEAVACDYEGDSPPTECLEATAASQAQFNTTSEFLTSFQYLKGGLEAGYESDQKFDATQSTLGIFLYAQYEDWGTHSWAGKFKVTPSLRLAVNRINPNDDTPRALAGDDSSYYRVSGDVSVWMPLGTLYDRILVFTANYRHYSELDPSSIVKDTRLDSYNLRTFSLSGPNGLFVSYSSGKLPFDQQSDDVVALGFKTYFK